MSNSIIDIENYHNLIKKLGSKHYKKLMREIGEQMKDDICVFAEESKLGNFILSTDVNEEYVLINNDDLTSSTRTSVSSTSGTASTTGTAGTAVIPKAPSVLNSINKTVSALDNTVLRLLIQLVLKKL